jgi:predicted transcriptional regulator
MNLLFSVRPNYLDRIFSLEKTVELRNRPIRVQANSWMWLYATSPRKCLEGRARIYQVVIDTPPSIWRRFKDELGITDSEFVSYVGTRSLISAIQLTNIERFMNPLRLNRIRQTAIGFHPPQSYLRLTADTQVYQLLKAHAACNYTP